MMLQKLDAYTKLIANLADKPNLSASDLKAYFDNSPEEIRVAFNNLIDALKAITDGDSGADNIGATAIQGLSGATVQALLESLKSNDDTNYTSLHDQIQGIVLGQIPDGSITPVKLSTDAKKAVNITVDDTAGHFTATEVEDVLAELFQFANDGKTNIATVVGSPATTSDTFNELQTHIQDAKNTMATNLTNKGQTSSGTEALQALADKIANVSTGKKWASGTTNSDTSKNITITGLSFTPTIIVAIQGMYNNPQIGLYVNDFNINHQYPAQIGVNSGSSSVFYITENEFTIIVGTTASLTNVKWYAFE